MHPNIPSLLVRYRLCYGGFHSPFGFLGFTPPPPQMGGSKYIDFFPQYPIVFEAL